MSVPVCMTASQDASGVGLRISDAAAVSSTALPVAFRLASAASTDAHFNIRLVWTIAPHSAADMHSETQMTTSLQLS